MTFRMRLTVLASLAVAIALVGASVVVYYSYRHDLIGQVDGELGASLNVAPLNQMVTIGSTGLPVSAVSCPIRRLRSSCVTSRSPPPMSLRWNLPATRP
jgi:hypothetical protein